MFESLSLGDFMKKILLLAVTALSVTGFIFAHDYGPHGPNGRPGQFFERRIQNDGEALTLNGTLDWVDGRIALKAGDKTYFISGIRELLGFVDGLKEGAELTLTGRAYNMAYIPEYGLFRTEKVTFNGKDYQLNSGGFAGARHGRRF
jgi:hypothetical protein